MNTGFRCYKIILFLTGFLFGLVIVFLICQEEDLLPQYGNIGNLCPKRQKTQDLNIKDKYLNVLFY